MPRRTLGQFVDRALAAGLPGEMPAVAIASATLANQRHVAGTIAELAALAAELPARVPVIVIVGEVTRNVPAAALLAEVEASAA